MVSLISAAGLLVIVVVNTAIAAVLTRFFRLRLATRFGTVLFLVVLAPLALIASLLLLSGVLRLGGDVGDQAVAVVVGVVLPLALGASIDMFWMPAPKDVELPERP